MLRWHDSIAHLELSEANSLELNPFVKFDFLKKIMQKKNWNELDLLPYRFPWFLMFLTSRWFTDRFQVFESHCSISWTQVVYISLISRGLPSCFIKKSHLFRVFFKKDHRLMVHSPTVSYSPNLQAARLHVWQQRACTWQANLITNRSHQTY